MDVLIATQIEHLYLVLSLGPDSFLSWSYVCFLCCIGYTN